MKATTGDPASVVRWPPAPSPGGVIGMVALIFCLFFAALSALSLTAQTTLSLPRILALVLIVIFLLLAAIFGYLLYGYATMRYELTSDQLTIRWAGKRHEIPIGAVQQVLPAVERLDPNPPGWQRFWPGYYVGEQATLSGLVMIVATLRARRQILLVTREYQFAISPERPVLFLEAFAQLRGGLESPSPESAADWQPAELTARFVEAGWTTPYPAVPQESQEDQEDVIVGTIVHRAAASPRSEPPRPAALPQLWSDPVAAGLLIAMLVIDIALTLFILVRYSSFPETVAIHWNSSGAADQFGPTRQVWTIPLLTWLVTIANVAFAWFADRFDRFAARFLLAASLAVELTALIALYWFIH